MYSYLLSQNPNLRIKSQQTPSKTAINRSFTPPQPRQFENQRDSAVKAAKSQTPTPRNVLHEQRDLLKSRKLEVAATSLPKTPKKQQPKNRWLERKPAAVQPKKSEKPVHLELNLEQFKKKPNPALDLSQFQRKPAINVLKSQRNQLLLYK
jgi:hypothetical protein